MSEAAREHSIEVRAVLAELGRVLDIADRLWEQYSLDPGVQADLNISIEEILSNIIRHGGPDAEPIRLRISVDPATVRIEIEDHGIPFNPLAHPLPDTCLPLEKRRPGGLGILMVRNLMDRTAYERREGSNSFTMTKHRATEAS